MTRTVLLGWERGPHPDHAERLLAFAGWFARHGWRPVVALKDLRQARAAEASAVPVLQAPLWPADLAAARWAFDPEPTLESFLLDSGAGHPSAVRATVSGARALIDLLDPDLVVAETAPALTLAARGRVPVIVTGSGGAFPGHVGDPEMAGRLLALFTETLGLTGTADSLGALFTGDARLVTDQAGLMADDAPAPDCLPVGARSLPPAAASGPLLFDLPPQAAQDDVLVAALMRYPGPRTVWTPGLPPVVSGALARAGVTVLTAPPEPAAFGTVSGVVHAHGPALTTRLASAGIPQLILNSTPEMAAVGAAVAAAGGGAAVAAGQIGLPEMIDHLHALASPDRARGSTLALSAQLKSDPLPDWPEVLAEVVERLQAEQRLR